MKEPWSFISYTRDKDILSRTDYLFEQLARHIIWCSILSFYHFWYYGVRKRTAVFHRAKTFLPHFSPQSKCFSRTLRTCHPAIVCSQLTPYNWLQPACNKQITKFLLRGSESAKLRIHCCTCRFCQKLVSEAFSKFLSAGTKNLEESKSGNSSSSVIVCGINWFRWLNHQKLCEKICCMISNDWQCFSQSTKFAEIAAFNSRHFVSCSRASRDKEDKKSP